jgi:hypothetical protein
MTDFMLAAALLAAGPDRDLKEKLKLYGWLIGRWTMQARLQPEPGRFVEAKGDIVFGWILEGRAMQDVWNLPGWFHGTTLRSYDPAIDAWHILWNEPFKQYYTHMIGRADGADIVQLGKNKEGRDIRWRFSEITADAFRWTGEVMTDSGWYLQSDIAATRVEK